jgi:hypothetical protein
MGENYVRLRSHPDEAAAYAQKVATIFAPIPQNLLGIEIGNEPDFGGEYPKTYAGFEAEWLGEAKAIRTGAPGVQFVGPSTAGLGWSRAPNGSHVQHLDEFVRVAGKDFGLEQVSFHNYAFAGGGMNACAGGGALAPAMNRVRCLLSMDKALEERAYFRDARDAAPGKTLVLNEVNSATAAPGPFLLNVSDSPAQTVWALDLLFNAMEVGVQRFNFHHLVFETGGASASDGAYNAIAYPPARAAAMKGPQSNTQANNAARDANVHAARALANSDQERKLAAQPLYYAMLAASHARNGELLQTTVINKPGWKNVQWHAVEMPDQKHVVLYIVNKELRTQGYVDVESAGFSGAGMYLVGGNNLTDNSPDAVKLDGKVVDPNTDTIPAPTYARLVPKAGAFRVSVPIGNAAVVLLTRN